MLNNVTMLWSAYHCVLARLVCVLCQPVHSYIKPSVTLTMRLVSFSSLLSVVISLAACHNFTLVDFGIPDEELIALSQGELSLIATTIAGLLTA